VLATALRALGALATLGALAALGALGALAALGALRRRVPHLAVDLLRPLIQPLTLRTAVDQHEPRDPQLVTSLLHCLRPRVVRHDYFVLCIISPNVDPVVSTIRIIRLRPSPKIKRSMIHNDHEVANRIITHTGLPMGHRVQRVLNQTSIVLLRPTAFMVTQSGDFLPMLQLSRGRTADPILTLKTRTRPCLCG